MNTQKRFACSETTELVLAVLMLLSCLLFLLMPTFLGLLPREQVRTNSINVHFDGTPTRLGSRDKICRAVADHRALVVSVRGTINELRNYQNLFQTSSLNSGIRVEIDETGTVGMVVANESDLGFAALLGAGTVTPGPIRMVFAITNANSMVVRVGKSSSRADLVGPRPACDNIVIGLGYDESRTTSGTLDIQFTTFADRPRFVGLWVEDLTADEFFRTVALSLVVFCSLLIVLNIAERSSDNARDDAADLADGM
jgi:hypothetical protein